MYADRTGKMIILLVNFMKTNSPINNVILEIFYKTFQKWGINNGFSIQN